uniref:Uncharacterized protein n=1 Tax=Heterorhabditis bacteriophora TaxID=37862 RepID=A0A1I7WLN3_HETBA
MEMPLIHFVIITPIPKECGNCGNNFIRTP